MFDSIVLESSATEEPPRSVEPSSELLARWDEADAARYGEPIDPDDDPGWVPDVPLGQVGDFELVEQVAEYERIASWARARQLAVIAALSKRPSMNPSWPVPVAVPNITGEEVAARLGMSRSAGRDLVHAATAFAEVLFPTARALHRGDLDWGKARIIIAALRRAPGQVALTVQETILPTAGRRTHSQLRRDLQRALLAADPLDADQRHVRAADERRVCRPTVLPDGMAGMWAVLPAAVAARIDATLGARARCAKHVGDPRTLDQLRADAFTELLLASHAHPGPHPGSGTPTAFGTAGAAFGPAGTSTGCGSPVPAEPVGQLTGAQINVAVALTTLLGLDEQPAELAGYGPITAQTARRLASAGTWRRILTDPVTGAVLDVGTRRYQPPADLAELIRARDQHCLSPICLTAARDCDLDHRDPFRPDGSGGATSADNLGSLCRRDHLLKTHGGWSLRRDPDPGLEPGSGSDPGSDSPASGPAGGRPVGYVWTTPTGHTYRHEPEPLPGHHPPPTDNGWTDPPPF